MSLENTHGQDEGPPPRQRILVVEDEAAMRRLNMEVLKISGYEVDTASDGAQGWEALQLCEYDLLVTDNSMPRMTGLELVERLHELNPRMPVIMATGTPPDLEFAKEYETKPVILQKPYTYAELLNTVTQLLSPNKA